MQRITLAIIAVVVASLMVVYSAIFSANTTPHFIDVRYHTLNASMQKEVKCLAENIYFESAHEPDVGKMAVAFVTLNRMHNKDFPSTVCEVVTQKTKNTCQFSWFCILKDKTPRNHEIYQKILDMASFIYVNYDKMEDPSYGALYYHADYVNPKWKNLNHVTTIGRHIFYVPATKVKDI